MGFVADAITEIKSLLFWSMLAASTVGPGTVIMCSKAGAEYQLQLLWALSFASVVAFTLQEGAGRLFIVSGFEFGQAMQAYFGSHVASAGLSVCLCVAVGISFGNLCYEANNFVGAMSSVYMLVPRSLPLQVLGSVGLGLACMGTMLAGRVDQISEALGWVVLLMVGLFSAAAAAIGVNGGAAAVLSGATVPTVPAGSGVMVLSLMGTTAIPFNIFLSSACSEGYSLAGMRRGIAFATLMTCVLSMTIVIVGSGVQLQKGQPFTVKVIGDALKKALGDEVEDVFAGGLFAAAFSSCLTVLMGTTIACRSLLAPPPPSQGQPGHAALSRTNSVNPVDGVPMQQGGGVAGGGGGAGGGAGGGSINMGGGEGGILAPEVPKSRVHRQPSLIGADIGEEDEGYAWSPKGWKYRGSMWFTLGVSSAIAASGANAVMVVATAQIMNGLLLPVIATCLLLLLNEPRFMRKRPQSTLDNALLVLTVTVTVFLACFVVIENISKFITGLSSTTEQQLDSEAILFWLSGVLTAVIMLPLLLATARKVRRAAEEASYGEIPSADNTRAAPSAKGLPAEHDVFYSDNPMPLGGGGPGGQGGAGGDLVPHEGKAGGYGAFA